MRCPFWMHWSFPRPVTTYCRLATLLMPERRDSQYSVQDANITRAWVCNIFCLELLRLTGKVCARESTTLISPTILYIICSADFYAFQKRPCTKRVWSWWLLRDFSIFLVWETSLWLEPGKATAEDSSDFEKASNGWASLRQEEF